jgi:hypothetical protein
MNKIKKSVTLDPDICEDIEAFASDQKLKFSQALNLIAASFFASTGKGDKYTKEILSKLVKSL